MLTVPSIFLQPGIVINPITGNAGFIEVGLYPRGLDRLARKVSEAFKKAGFAGGVNEWVMKAKAAKCLGNLANAMGAITDGRGIGEEFMAEARKEVMAVWREAGIEWEDQESFRKRTQSRRGVSKMPEGYIDQRNLGSSWQSLMRKTGNIEAEQLNGDVVRLGRLLGLPTPHNEVLWKVAGEMARHREKPGKYSAEELLQMVRDKIHILEEQPAKGVDAKY